MRSSEIRAAAEPSGGCCVVGYGNSHRRDDGLGPFVAAALEKKLRGLQGPRFLVRRQLDVDLLDEIEGADTLILVDASVRAIPKGWSMERVAPKPERPPWVTHTLEPGYFIALLAMLHDHRPAAWLVSIQGEDFGYGRGLTSGARRRARSVIADLTEFVSMTDTEGED